MGPYASKISKRYSSLKSLLLSNLFELFLKFLIGGPHKTIVFAFLKYWVYDFQRFILFENLKIYHCTVWTNWKVREVGVNQADSLLSITNGHITHCEFRFDGACRCMGVCGCLCGELIWIRLVWAERSTPDSFWEPSLESLKPWKVKLKVCLRWV